ncbi:hypothetical protein C1X59_08175 [Pseudomonas sp. FW215-R2]|nr:hypothetical protein C1X59_08175 [Pseudomonas sp. FW215-R2]
MAKLVEVLRRQESAFDLGVDLSRNFWIRRFRKPQGARSDVFDSIKMFYNAKGRHGVNNRLSMVKFEKRFTVILQGA